MTEQLANNAITTLNGGITSTATSLIVNSAALFPTSPQFRILVDSELMLVTGVSGTTFTVSRGVESTTQTSHNSGANVALVLTVGAIQQFRADTVKVGTFANRPAAGNAGRIYYPTNSNMIFVDNGASWTPIGPYVPLNPVPAANTFTIYNTAGNATIVDDNGGLFITGLSLSTGGQDGTIFGQANPGGTGTAYTLIVGFNTIPGESNGVAGSYNFSCAGVGIYNVANNQFRSMISYGDSTGAFRLQLRGATGFRAATTNTFDVGGYPWINGPMLWMRIVDDGTTNRTWSVSSDGRHFTKLATEARTTGFTSQPDRIGIYISTESVADVHMNILSYSLTSP